jgi:hypothetical protein
MNYGMANGLICEPAQGMARLSEDWTKIPLVRTYGPGMADGGIDWGDSQEKSF